jgi:hypothetical protein
MRLLLLPLVFAFLPAAVRAADAPRPATTEELALFEEALKGGQQDPLHWAYTETATIRDKAGKVRNEVVLRYDPSKPYAEQYTPLRIDGKVPTEKQRAEYRKRGEAEAKKRLRDAEAAKGRDAKEPPRLWINQNSVILDVAHPLVAAAEPGHVIFEIPLRSDDHAFPVEKLQLRARVDRESRQLQWATFEVLKAFRMKLVAKIKSCAVRMEFARVNPEFGPVIRSVAGEFGASLVFVPFTGTFATERTEWERVRAFDEKFNVKIAPLQLLGF